MKWSAMACVSLLCLTAQALSSLCASIFIFLLTIMLAQNQYQLADRAEIIITALAKTGIVGLIDEATGYQQIRARDALQAYLDRVLRKELASWVRRFPNEFFEQIYRLNEWA